MLDLPGEVDANRLQPSMHEQRSEQQSHAGVQEEQQGPTIWHCAI